jgi:hypothetical protein
MERRFGRVWNPDLQADKAAKSDYHKSPLVHRLILTIVISMSGQASRRPLPNVASDRQTAPRFSNRRTFAVKPGRIQNRPKFDGESPSARLRDCCGAGEPE